MNLSMKQKQTHRHREQTCGGQGGGGWGDAVGGWGGVSRYKLLYMEWINRVLTVQHKKLYSISYDKQQWKRIF